MAVIKTFGKFSDGTPIRIDVGRLRKDAATAHRIVELAKIEGPNDEFMALLAKWACMTEAQIDDLPLPDFAALTEAVSNAVDPIVRKAFGIRKKRQ